MCSTGDISMSQARHRNGSDPLKRSFGSLFPEGGAQAPVRSRSQENSISTTQKVGECMPSRRKFLSTMPVLGAAVAQSLRSTRLAGETHEAHANEARSIVLEHGWQFCLGSDAVKSPAELAGGGTPWREVSVPHTWQALGGSPDYVGSAWYRAAIAALG